jgi:predicted ATP-dependent Lon-type protease
LRTCLDLAVEYRQRTHDWLCQVSPGEFERKRMSGKEFLVKLIYEPDPMEAILSYLDEKLSDMIDL